MSCNGTAAVAGAGLSGRLLAWRLLRRGWRVSVYDRSDSQSGRGAAAWVAAGMIAADAEAAEGVAQLTDYGTEAPSLWRDWLPQLQADSGREIFHGFDGSLVVAHSADRSELTRLQARLTRRLGKDRGRWSHLERPALRELEPSLATNFSEGLYLPAEGFIDNRQLLEALHDAILARGGVWRSATAVERLEAGWVHHRAGSDPYEFVADCRGCGAGNCIEELRGVRGEVIRLRAPEVDLKHPVRLMHPRYHLYVVPRPDNHYVIGASEIESDSERPVSVRSALELLSALFTLHTGFAEAEIIELASACRPAFPDNLPRLIQRPGLVMINGLFRSGFVLAPVLVREALQNIEPLRQAG